MMQKLKLLCASIALTGSVFVFDVRGAETLELHPQTAKTNGPITPLQSLYDVKHYALQIDVQPDNQFIRGEVTMTAKSLGVMTTVELDLDPRFETLATKINGNSVPFKKEGGKLLLSGRQMSAGMEFTTTVQYQGHPHVAERAPWDGGFVWTKTPDGQDWVGTAVQGNGCDLYWPCKDHVYDKADSGADMVITVPKHLSAVMNGKLIEERQNDDDTKSFHWRTVNPIAAYHLALNVGPFKKYELTHHNKISGADGIPLVFYHVTDDQDKIEGLIRDDFLKQLAFFEDTLGPYPWGNEKIGIVEIPYLGMEHQTMNGYGNGFKRDPHGFDWLIQHEFSHEWFGNLLTQEGTRDFWLHEGFGFYMQPVYAQHVLGDMGYASYMWSRYNQIANCTPVVPDGEAFGDYWSDNDPYFKGAWVIHTFRRLVGDEIFWRVVRRALYDTVDPWALSYPITPQQRNTEDFVKIASEEAGRDMAWLFDTYLKQATLPVLKVNQSEDLLELSWANTQSGDFPMPVPVMIDGTMTLVNMPGGKGSIEISENSNHQIDPHMSVLRDFGTSAKCSR
ncbi:M1 family metallopeptidase [Kordiimonas sp. SCSIO 12610]|uniref:M1 family metallopeptidase n=1 Tax=Kordiimonas sp. SCSIO 12610 TaxID=2829597 RepID=UPI00210D579A|nr:M1 family metallopeptidase [Kordiimonas sp. SCSIO 12610]UTW54916.1 M1 family metallopeptidase [Kordiimonas sp. SCSIO 12610]